MSLCLLFILLGIYGTIFFVLLSILHPKFLLLNELLTKIHLPFIPNCLLPWMAESLTGYFEHTYTFEQPQETYTSRPMIKCFSPHGILPYSIFFTYHPDLHHLFSPATNTLTVAQQLFQFPILTHFARDVLHAIPNHYDAMNDVLRKNHSLLVYMGGIREMMATDHRKEILYIRRRRGIFQLALKYGMPLLPIYTFGLSEVYKRGRTSLRLPDLFGNEEESIAWMWGVYGTLYPLQKRLFTVFGTPLEVKKIDQPTQEDIDTLKKRYIEALRSLYLRWREKYDPAWKDRELLVI